jgi:hypothetical protein
VELDDLFDDGDDEEVLDLDALTSDAVDTATEGSRMASASIEEAVRLFDYMPSTILSSAFTDLMETLPQTVIPDMSSLAPAICASMPDLSSMMPNITSMVSGIGGTFPKQLGGTFVKQLGGVSSIAGFMESFKVPSVDAIAPAVSLSQFAGLGAVDAKSLGLTSMLEGLSVATSAAYPWGDRMGKSMSGLDELFGSPALEPYRFSEEALDAALDAALAEPTAAPDTVVPSVEPVESPWDRMEVALVQLVRIGEVQATHLDRMVAHADDGARSGQRQFRYGIAVGALGVLVGVLTLWFTWQMWLSAK